MFMQLIWNLGKKFSLSHLLWGLVTINRIWEPLPCKSNSCLNNLFETWHSFSSKHLWSSGKGRKNYTFSVNSLRDFKDLVMEKIVIAQLFPLNINWNWLKCYLDLGVQLTSNETPDILGEDIWKLYWITWSNNVISFGAGSSPSNKTLLKWKMDIKVKVGEIGFASAWGALAGFR